MWNLLKSYDNRRTVKRTECVGGRIWTRRCQWLVSNEKAQVKLKFELISTENELYLETLVPASFAQKVWDRFKEGQSVEDSLSFFGLPVPKAGRYVF